MGDVRILHRNGQRLLHPSPLKQQHVLVPLTTRTEKALNAICEEGYTAAGYLAFLLEQDIGARLDSGWTPERGWQDRMEASHPTFREER